MNREHHLLTFPDPRAQSLSIRASAIVFADPLSQALLALTERVAPSDANILVIGDTGTGKELIARQVHASSKRAARPFVAINCGAFPDNLFESELFGYERGAFTGAMNAREGWFETADGGTLFLDEIGDLPLLMQAKLLRVLQEGEIVRIGARRPVQVDVRLIAATNVDLEDAVLAGRFREDLYYRLKVVTLPLAPLRDRPGDIIPLVRHFVSKYATRLNLQDITLSADAIQRLLTYPWPGNIRELENVIHRALLTVHGKVLHADDLNLPMVKAGVSAPEPRVVADQRPVLERFLLEEFARGAPRLLDELIASAVQAAYDHAGQNQVKAAALLGVSRNTLRTHLKRLALIV
jgi:sigma-54 dependent transcriptional regulator